MTETFPASNTKMIFYTKPPVFYYDHKKQNLKLQNSETNKLIKFITKEFPQELGFKESAIDISIRLLKRYKKGKIHVS